MDPNHKSIITEDGQRLTVDNGEIIGTEDSGPGLAYETGSTVLNEPVNTEAKEATEDTSEEG